MKLPSNRLLLWMTVAAFALLPLVSTGIAADNPADPVVAARKSPASSAPPSNAAAFKEIKASLDSAAALLDESKPLKAMAMLAEAVQGIEEVSQLERVPAGLRLLIDRCKSLKSDLEIEGVDVAGITIPAIKPVAPKASKPQVANALVARPVLKPAPGKLAPNGISFSGQVAPILAKNCGGCHIAGKKGDFQMVSYEMLMKSGMVQRGVGNASRLVEVILSGDMPRGGGKVSPADVGILMRWIDAGAAFDGGNPATPLDMLARGAAAGPPVLTAPMVKAMDAVALKPGDISFADSVAPVLLKNCAGCHGGNEAQADLKMLNLETLLKGGRSGSPIVVGKGVDSLLIKKLKGVGIEGQRMPLEKPPLADDVIAMIEKWVNQGIKLDALTPQASLETIVAAGVAKKISHTELVRIRFEAGKKLWTNAIPDEDPAIVQRETVSVIGNVSPSRLAEIADAAEVASSRVHSECVDGGSPLLKGGVVIYVFAKGYDYSGFWQNVLAKERPKGLAGNAGVVGDVVYAALVAPSGDSEETQTDYKLQLAEQIAAAAFISRGAPEWFACGAGRLIAGKTAAKAPLAKAWREELPGSLQQIGSSKDFLTGHSDPVAMASVSGGFVGSIATSGNRIRLLIKDLDAGTAFDKAFITLFRQTPQVLFEAWAAKQGLKPVRPS